MSNGYNDGMPVYPLEDWSVATLRLTVFPVMAERNMDVSWWSQVVGREPERQIRRTGPSRIEVSGALTPGASRLTLKLTPIRTDWILSAEPSATDAVLETIDTFPATLPLFLPLMARWLNSSDPAPVQRLAFGALLHHPETSRQATYERLARYLSRTIRVDAASSDDLLLQVNWPVSSRIVQGLRINRLSKWGATLARLMTLTPAGVSTPSEDTWATTLELDINTAAEHAQPLPNDGLVPLLEELLENARTVAAEGDDV